jgi:accessory Sec system S-layer assembly protein
LSTEQTVATTLSIHPDWNISQQEFYVYQFHHMQLPPLKPNQINITGIKLEQFDDFFMITAFIRSTLPKPIQFELLDLVVLDDQQKPLARETFDMERFGVLPENSARPWRFIFDNEVKLTDDPLPSEGWTIAFELKKKETGTHQLDLEPSWEKMLTEDQKSRLIQLMEHTPPLKPNEVNFLGLEAKINEDNNLVVTLLIRNGSLKNIQIDQLPLVVEDAKGKVIAKGLFTFDQFVVKANTSKPWTFIFPKELLTEVEPDLTGWKVYPPKANDHS